MSERLTADIIVQGRMPTPSEYKASISLLKEVASAGEHGLSAWRAASLNETETRAWIANAQAGLTRNRPDRPWEVVVLTELGKLYLSQRS